MTRLLARRSGRTTILPDLSTKRSDLSVMNLPPLVTHISRQADLVRIVLAVAELGY